MLATVEPRGNLVVTGCAQAVYYRRLMKFDVGELGSCAAG
jgi:hypothetical protein